MQNILVIKPWGYEYPVYSNGAVACWLLRVNKGCSTSLHAHAKKRTAVVLLNGIAQVQYLNDHTIPNLHALDKTSFGPHFFHRHLAITDIDLLEVETPVDKDDVHRFKDDYGREGKPYEDESCWQPLPEDYPRFNNGGILDVGDAVCRLYIETKEEFYYFATKSELNAAIVILDGCLTSRHGVKIVIPGHVVWLHNLRDLLQLAVPSETMTFILIWRKRAKDI